VRVNSNLRNDRLSHPVRRAAGPLQRLAPCPGFHARPDPALTTPRSAAYCGICVVLAYFVRGTVLPSFLPIPDLAFTFLCGLSVLAASALVIANGGPWRCSWLIVLSAFALSLCNAEYFATAALHWASLALLIASLGPLVMNPSAVALRSTAWTLILTGSTSLTALFVLWYLLRLPSFGAGAFSAFLNHCMLMGPLCGIGVSIAAARALHRRSWLWALLALLGMLPLIASGSRVATLAALGALSFLLVRRKPLAGLGFLFLCAALIALFVSGGRVPDGPPESLTGAMMEKGVLNSRADYWASRLSEFRASPFCGIGIMMATGSGADVGKDGKLLVEPGSSYLSLVAMTGTLGALSFCLALAPLLFRFALSPPSAPLDKDILTAVGIYLAIHANAEGWLLAFGSPMCALFWLWLGQVGRPADRSAPRRQLCLSACRDRLP